MKTLTIGSCDIDVFITPMLSSSLTQTDTDVSFRLGDKVPININGMYLGGNGSNVSVGLKRLGMESYFYSFFGNDLFSHLIHDSIDKEGVTLINHDGLGDNTSVSLIFDFDHDRVIFSHHDTREHKFNPSTVDRYDAMYLTSIGKEWVGAYKEILTFIHASSMMVAFSPGSPQFADLQDVVYEIIAASQLIFVNKEEGEKLLAKKGETATDVKDLLVKLSKMGPPTVSVTDGKEGAYAYRDGSFYFSKPFDTQAQTIDKTGAGDSYAAGFFAALLLGKDIKEAMRWGLVNSNSVMQKVGAEPGLLTPDTLEAQISSHADFQIDSI
ncbi:MAG: carbohydrate kinase family protein [Candidatus Levyibacteriota bacterium]